MAGALLSAIGAPIVLLGLHRQAALTATQRRAFVALVLLLVAAFGLRSLDAAVDNVREVHEFDFVGFWLHGETASRGLDFYDPRNAQEWARGLELSETFRLEIVDVGFWYPPPSAFLFAPLGWIDDVQDALGAWLAAMAVVLAVAIRMLWKEFLAPFGLVGLAAAAALLLCANATTATFELGQTNFVALVALLGFWRTRDRPVSGVWATFAVLVKPFLGVLVVHQVVRKRWGSVLASVVSGAVACVLSIAAFGWDTFTAFFTNDQVASKPDFVYTEDANQSLLSFVLRAADVDFAGRSPITTPLFLVAAGILGAVTVAVVLARRDRDPRLSLALWLLLGLLLYPSSLGHYSVLLVPILLLLWQQRASVPGGVWSVAATASATYLLAGFRGGTATTLAYLLLWAVCAFLQWTAAPEQPAEAPASGMVAA